MLGLPGQGEALDELVATEVMGWNKQPCGRDPERYGAQVYSWHDAKGRLRDYCQDYMNAEGWSPPAKLVDAFDALSRFRPYVRITSLGIDEKNDHSGLWTVWITVGGPDINTMGEFLPTAICHAVIEAARQRAASA